MDNKEQDSKPAANPNLPLDLDIHNDHHNGHDNDDDDDDDEDNWSRQVERDDITAAGVLLGDSFRMESVAEQDAGSSPGTRDKQETDSDQGRTVGSSTLPLAPTQPELSMKEKLVLRERQRRIETERARLKRQFALNNDQEERPDAAQNHTAVTALSEAAAGSAAGTLGEESTKAHPDEESADQEKLGFNMERFLRNSDTFNPELEPTAEDKPPAQPDQGPVMERFLNDPVVMETDKVEAAVLSRADVQRSVSFDVTDAPLDASEGGGGDGSGGDDGMLPHGIVGSLPSFNEINGSIDANASVLVQADEDDVARDPLTTPMPSMDVQESIADSEDGSAASTEEPRVLRLTEADMQEMAAIEEASIGNAPPSERTEEDLSEIGELAGFGSHNVPDNAGNFSQDTPTTAMESASMHSGNQSAHRASTTTHDHSADQHSLDGMPSMSISSQLLVSPGASGYPPSDTARDEGPPSIDRDIPNNEHVRSEEPQQLALSEHENEDMQLRDRTDSDSANSEGLVNRRMRPGMVNLRPQANHSPIMDRAAASRSPAPPVVVEGFDFDKHEPMSPQTDHEDSLRDLPVDVGWSPAGDTMHVSPIQIRSLAARLPTTEEEPTAGRNNYGSMEEGRAAQGTNLPFAPMPDFKINEIRPLLGSDVPPEIITRRTSSGRSSSFDRTNPRNNSSGMSLASIVETVFHNVQEEEEKEKIRNEAALYEASSVLQKGKAASSAFLRCNHLLQFLTCVLFSFSRAHVCTDRDTHL